MELSTEHVSLLIKVANTKYERFTWDDGTEDYRCPVCHANPRQEHFDECQIGEARKLVDKITLNAVDELQGIGSIAHDYDRAMMFRD